MAGEPVARHGPFVMNTKQELEQAFQDFHQATNGFEKAKTWRSLAGNIWSYQDFKSIMYKVVINFYVMKHSII